MTRPTKKKTGRHMRARRGRDAIALLKADHRQVAKWFAQFQKARTASRKSTLAGQICGALTVHMAIEEQIFYPAFIAATKDADTHHEAIVEHAGAKYLIRQIENSGPADDYFVSKVHVLAEMIKHHVKEEEQRGGMFAEARASKMDLSALGARLLERKRDLMANRS